MTPTSSCRTLIKVAVQAPDELCAAATCTAQTGSRPKRPTCSTVDLRVHLHCTLRHGSANALRSARTLSRSWLSTAMINGGTMAASGCTLAPAPRSSSTHAWLPKATARPIIVVGCCFGGRILGSALACRIKKVRHAFGLGYLIGLVSLATV